MEHGRGGIVTESAQSGAHPRGAKGSSPPWELKNTIFSGFLPLNYVIWIFKVCFWSCLLCGRTEEACSMVDGLRKVDFPHPTGHSTRNFFSGHPLRKSWVRPWAQCFPRCGGTGAAVVAISDDARTNIVVTQGPGRRRRAAAAGAAWHRRRRGPVGVAPRTYVIWSDDKLLCTHDSVFKVMVWLHEKCTYIFV